MKSKNNFDMKHFDDIDFDKIDIDSDEVEFIDGLFKEHFEKDLSFNIPDNFADNVCVKVKRRNTVWEAITKHLFYTLGILSIVGISVGLFYYLDVSWWSEFQFHLTQFKWLLVSIFVCYEAIQFGDILLVRKRFE